MARIIARTAALFAALALLLSACGQAAPQTSGAAQPTAASGGQASGGTSGASGEPIPLGVAVAQTSNVALLGQDQVDGVKIAEAYFNKKGGVNGKPIKLILQDTAGDEQGA